MEFNNIEKFDPSTCVAGKVMRIKRITANVFRKHLAPFNITDSQLTIMFVMSKRRRTSQKELGDLIFLEKSSLSRNLNRLIERKLLDKSEFPKLEITTDGLYFVENIIPIWEKAMQEIREKIGEDGEASLNLVYDQLTV